MPTDIGQRDMKVFTLVKSGDPVPLLGFCEDGKFDCNFVMPVYANGSTEDLENDKSSVLVMGQSWTTQIDLVLQQNVGGVWTDVDNITDNTYGDFYAMGDFISKPKYSGIVIHWKEVLNIFGVGEFRVKSVETIPLGTNTVYSKPWCLHEYVCAPDNTVRLEWWLNKGIGDIENDREILDFSDINWYNQVRIPMSFFGHPKSEYEQEEVQYTNGQREDVTSKQEERYVLKLGPIPAWLHNIIKTYAFQSGTLQITDYSNNNPQSLIRKAVKRTSSYEPRWKISSKCAPVTVEVTPTYNRLERYKCL